MKSAVIRRDCPITVRLLDRMAFLLATCTLAGAGLDKFAGTNW